jgi:5-methyltetrahydrofolate--homocysteine methyltransferase
MDKRCTYDPLHELMAYYANASAVVEKQQVEATTIEEKLKQRIINGDRLGIDADLRKALENYSALEIINTLLLDGMRVVGELFGSGQMQLPFVLQSAETMKTAVGFLEPFMEKVEDSAGKGTMVLATVKGDVHDIGKNLVDIILSNNGYKVVNLGIKVPLETMLHAVEEHKANALGMSGLLVKSTAIMKENLEQMQARGLRVPVVLGGAALTRRFVEHDLRALYGGPLAYAQDAFDGLYFMESLSAGETTGTNTTTATTATAQPPIAAREIEEVPVGLEAKLPPEVLSTEERAAGDVYAAAERARTAGEAQTIEASELPTSTVARTAPVPVAPFFGSRIEKDIAIDKVYEYINEVALIRGQWQFKRGKRSDEEYSRIMEQEALPALQSWKLKSKRERLLQPAVVYGYFPCKAHGNDLVVYRPVQDEDLHSTWTSVTPQTASKENLREWVRFSFPRQKDGRHLCISDFFRPAADDAFDVVAFHIVTVGTIASTYAHELFDKGEFKDYLFFHGLSVESAEALAEYWHKIIRSELGIATNDAPEIKSLFSQGYQGSRYSFGYPACPNLEDQQQLFTLLKPERIGVQLTEEFQLVPEQSTSAIVCHHSEARYFTIK